MIVDANGLQIFCQSDGRTGDPVVLLVAGLGAQAPDWDARLVNDLVSAGFRVVRFDNRDSGESPFFDAVVSDLVAVMSGDASTLGYRLDDMAADAAGVLDALGVEAAHVVGHSLGAMVAQLLAINHPERVLTLTSIAGTTGNRSVGQPHPEVVQFLLSGGTNTNEEERVAAAIRASTSWSSMEKGVTPEYLAERARRRIARGAGRGSTERQLAAAISAADRTTALAQIAAPTLVIHGSDDPLIDASGGRATAEAIPSAELRILEGVKHDLPPAAIPEISSALIEHFRQ